MDILAHGLWTNIMYKVIPATKANKKTTYWGIFFGIFPDLWAFTPVFVYIFYNWIFHGQKFHFARPEDGGIIPLSSLTHHLYSLSHSLVIWAVVFIIFWLSIKIVFSFISDIIQIIREAFETNLQARPGNRKIRY